MGAGLKVYLLPAGPGAPRLREPFFRGKVHHINGRFRKLRDAHEPRYGLRLHGSGAGKRVPGRAGHPSSFYFRDAAVEHIPVFAVYADERAFALGGLERGVDRAVVHAERVIDHVELVGGHAPARHLRHFGFGPRVPFGNGHVETVIAGAAARLFLPGVKGLHERAAAVLRRKIEHSRRAAQDGRAAAGDEIVRRARAAGVKVEVGVGVDEAGEHEAARCVDAPGIRAGKSRAYGADAPILHEHIRPHAAACIHYGSVLNEYVHTAQPSQDRFHTVVLRK